MIYGATGYTGRLIAQEAVERGHRPVLAGRDASRLAPLAEQLGLDHRVFNLQHNARLTGDLDGMSLVMHCAGPFTLTSGAMLGACLSAGAHYLDITGEIAVFENTFVFHQMALQRGIALISGCGFDVIPTDCLAVHVTQQTPNAVDLEIALATRTFGSPSAGTLQSMVEIMQQGGMARRGGRLVSLPLGTGGRTVRFSYGERYAMPFPWGDLATAYCSTGIPNITTYLRYKPSTARLLRWISPSIKVLFQLKLARRLVQAIIDRTVQGPPAEARQTGRSYIWARADDRAGHSAEAWLETLEGYEFTKIAAVRCVEKVLSSGHLAGALSPAMAFGPDFVLEIPGTRRYDRLE